MRDGIGDVNKRSQHHLHLGHHSQRSPPPVRQRDYPPPAQAELHELLMDGSRIAGGASVSTQHLRWDRRKHLKITNVGAVETEMCLPRLRLRHP